MSFVTPQNLTLPVSSNAPKATSVALNDGVASATEAFVIKAGLAQNLKGGVRVTRLFCDGLLTN